MVGENRGPRISEVLPVPLQRTEGGGFRNQHHPGCSSTYNVRICKQILHQLLHKDISVLPQRWGMAFWQQIQRRPASPSEIINEERLAICLQSSNRHCHVTSP